MRKFRSLILGVALLGLVAAPVAADHTVTLAFDPASPVVTGTVVDVNFQTNRSQGNAKLYQCFDRDPATGTIGTEPMPVAVCGMVEDLNAAPLAAATGAWVETMTADATNLTTYVFDTDGFIGTAGFAVQHPPLNHETGEQTFANLVVNPAGNGNGGDRHPGCNGIENALERVTTNNGAAKGNGKAAEVLAVLADKFNCDVADGSSTY
jgi:hypothetical protein